MTLLEIFLIGIGLSMDAFAVAICKGLAMPDKVHKRSAFLKRSCPRWAGCWAHSLPIM